MHSHIYLDKTIAVPPGKIVKTGYVNIHKIRWTCHNPVAFNDVKEKYELVKQNAPNSIFPTPIGFWDGDYFVIEDGRHTHLAYMMNGYTHMLVSWETD